MKWQVTVDADARVPVGMRKTSTIAALAFLLGSSAATASAQQIFAGARFGASWASQRSSIPFTDYGPRQGIIAGFSGTVELGRFVALQAEADYAQKGARLADTYKMQVDYLEVPLLARLTAPGWRGVRAFAAMGVAPAVELRCGGYTSGMYRLDFLSSSSMAYPGGTFRVPLDCNSQRLRYSDRGEIFAGGLLLDNGPRQVSVEIRRVSGGDISGYGCCELRNQTTSLVFGISRRLR